MVIGFFSYVALEKFRVWAFCPQELREGLDCYSPNWARSPHWVFSFSGGVIALVSICFTALLISTKRKLAIRSMYITGLLCAIPCTVLINSPWAYTAAAVTGGLAVMCVERLTSSSSGSSLRSVVVNNFGHKLIGIPVKSFGFIRRHTIVF